MHRTLWSKRTWFSLVLISAVAAFGLSALAAENVDISGTLGAHPYHHKGKAPVKINFVGKIAVKGVKKEPITVSYSFAFSDGSTQPGGDIVFKHNGARPIRTSWTFGTPGEKGEGWAELKITAPEERSICKANFSYEFK